MTSIKTHVALAAMVLSLLSPAFATADDEKPKTEQALLVPSLSSPEAVVLQMGGSGSGTMNEAVPVNLSRPMYVASGRRHTAMIFLTAVGAGALIGALIDGNEGAGKGVLFGAAVGAGYLIAVNF